MEAKLEFKKKIKGTQKIVPLIVGAAEEVIEGKYNNGKFYPVVEDKTLSKEFSPKIGKIYLDVSTDKQYKWDGEEYKEVNDNNVYTKNETYNKEETNNLVGNAENAIKVTYNELVTLRNNSQLVPGRFYRITDYENNSLVNFNGLTTHPFDIILLALTENKLAEEGWAAMHENIYDVTFDDGVTKKCYIYKTSNNTCNIVDVDSLLGIEDAGITNEIIINDEDNTAYSVEGVLVSTDLATPNLKYNYFQDENFSVWKLRYTIDIDDKKFNWINETGFIESLAYFIISVSYGNGYNAFNQKFIRYRDGDYIDNDTQYYAWKCNNYQYRYTGTPRTDVYKIIYSTTENIFSSTSIIIDTYTIAFNAISSIDYHPAIISPSFSKGVLYYLSKKNECKLKWIELKTLRDSVALIADSKYRIIDYQCTTVQENTRSAGHQFDIIVTALTEGKLSEEASAAMHEDIYDVTFDDGVTKKCWMYYTGMVGSEYNIVDCETLLGVLANASDLTIDDTNKTAIIAEITDALVEDIPYNYFQNSKLSAWKVWYCIDNDTDKFAWADDNIPQIFDGDFWCLRDATQDNEGYFAWYNEDAGTYFTNTLTPKAGDYTYDKVADQWISVEDNIKSIKGFGRGVIYRLIDEYDNDCPYDFKNIQYILKKGFTISYQTYGLRVKVYERDTSKDTTINTIPYYAWTKVSEPNSGGVDLPDTYWTARPTLDPIITRYVISEGVATKNTYGNMIAYSDDSFNAYTFDANSEDATVIRTNVYSNSIGSYKLGSKFNLNFIFFRNSSGQNLNAFRNTLDIGCHDIRFYNNCYNNYFGMDNYNVLLNSSCHNNSFGDYCYNNVIYSQSSYNSFKPECYNNHIGASCNYNSFGNKCYSNTIEDYSSYNSFNINCHDNVLGQICYNNIFLNECFYNTLSTYCQYNSFGDCCKYISISANSGYNVFEKNCQYINLQKTYMEKITVEDNNQYIDITSTQTTSGPSRIKNITIGKGVNISSTVKTISHDTVNDDFNTTYQNTNSTTVNV